MVVFEKQRSVGGSSNFFHGTFAVESAPQRERFITYSRDEAFRNIMEQVIGGRMPDWYGPCG